MKILCSGYEKSTKQLMFRVYAEELPETDRRQEHRAAHFAALDLLGAVLAEDFGVYHAEIRRIGLGKPKLMHDFLHMNLSHCKGLAAAAVGRIPLGVDAEGPRAVRPHLMEKLCTAEELRAIQSADNPEQMFSALWTLKESYAKYTGKGIALDFSALCFSLDADGTAVFHHPAAREVRFWHCSFDNHISVSLCYPDQNDMILIGGNNYADD